MSLPHNLIPFAQGADVRRGPGGRPPNPAVQMMRGNRLAWRVLPKLIKLLADVALGVEDAPIFLRVECAKYLTDRCLGKSAVVVQADITSKSLVITPSELAAEIAQLAQSLAVSQAQDTAKQLPVPAPPAEPEDLPF